jgi:hypothetical protein
MPSSQLKRAEKALQAIGHQSESPPEAADALHELVDSVRTIESRASSQRLMGKKPASPAMETQPPTDWRNSGTPMGQSASKRSKSVRASPPVFSRAEAEAKRRSALTKQRGGGPSVSF